LTPVQDSNRAKAQRRPPSSSVVAARVAKDFNSKDDVPAVEQLIDASLWHAKDLSKWMSNIEPALAMRPSSTEASDFYTPAAGLNRI
jgi:hypothetical protein